MQYYVYICLHRTYYILVNIWHHYQSMCKHVMPWLYQDTLLIYRMSERQVRIVSYISLVAILLMYVHRVRAEMYRMFKHIV